MKKSTIILIAIVYIASIVFISIFGLKSVVYSEIIPVTEIMCTNKSDSNSIVENTEDSTLIKVKFIGPANEEKLTGTMLQLNTRVLPDNASKKNLKYIYNEDLTRVKFIKDSNGNELGLILFTGKVILNIRIIATDGSQVYKDIVVFVY